MTVIVIIILSRQTFTDTDRASSSIYPSIYSSIYPSISIYSIYRSLYLSIYLFLYPFLHLQAIAASSILHSFFNRVSLLSVRLLLQPAEVLAAMEEMRL